MTTSQEWAERLGWEEPTTALTAPNPNRWLKEGAAVKNSERALAAIKPVPEREQPLSEQFRIVAKQWVELDGAARLLEETKTATLSQMMKRKGDVPAAHAERDVKSSPEWEEHIKKMVDARTDANLKKVQMEFIKMKFSEWNSHEANARSERKL